MGKVRQTQSTPPIITTSAMATACLSVTPLDVNRVRRNKQTVTPKMVVSGHIGLVAGLLNGARVCVAFGQTRPTITTMTRAR